MYHSVRTLGHDGKTVCAQLTRRWSRGGWVLVLLLIGPSVAAAEGFEDKDLSLRMPAAFSHFAPYADVAAVGGASAGSPWSTSINPASLAWQPSTLDLRLSPSAQYDRITFRNGTTLHVTSQSLSWDTGRFGVLQAALAQVRSAHASTRQGLGVDFDMDVAQAQWAKHLTDDWAVGTAFSFTKSGLGFDLQHTSVSDSNGETYAFRYGVLNRMAKGLLGGVVFDYAFSRDRTTLFDFMGLGTGDIHMADTTHQFVLRPGISYAYMTDSTVYADYQFVSFSNDTGRLQASRFLVGVEQGLVKGVYVRGGVSLDQRGNASWTTGFGISPMNNVSIDVGYQDNMFPELAPEFGRSRTLALSVCVSF